MQNLSLKERFMYYSGTLIASLGSRIVDDLKCIQNLLDAEEEGLLLKLPCKEGTEVYIIHADDCGNIPCMFGDCWECANAYMKIIKGAFDATMINEFGITVFLSEVEAKEALKKMEK